MPYRKKSFLLDATHPIIISWKSIEVTSYFIERELTQEENKDESVLKRELMAEDPLWDL